MNWRITPSPPLVVTVPDFGTTSPAIIRTSVVLPAPFGPTSATLAPSATRNETSANSTLPSGSWCRSLVTSTWPTVAESDWSARLIANRFRLRQLEQPVRSPPAARGGLADQERV